METFRKLKKRRLSVEVPVDLYDDVEKLTILPTRSRSEVVTELLCIAIRRDPKRYGITPVKRPRTAATA